MTSITAQSSQAYSRKASQVRRNHPLPAIRPSSLHRGSESSAVSRIAGFISHLAWVIHLPGHPQTRGRRPRRRRQVLRRHRVVAPLLRISLCASVFDPAAACSPPTPPPPTPPYRPKTTTPWLVKVPVPLSPPKPVFRMADIAALICRPPGRFHERDFGDFIAGGDAVDGLNGWQTARPGVALHWRGWFVCETAMTSSAAIEIQRLGSQIIEGKCGQRVPPAASREG